MTHIVYEELRCDILFILQTANLNCTSFYALGISILLLQQTLMALKYKESLLVFHRKNVGQFVILHHWGNNEYGKDKIIFGTVEDIFYLDCI